MSSSAPHLVERTSCPACGARGGTVLVSLPYDEDPLREYLRSFYRGRFDTSMVRAGTYELVECQGCTLVYQRWAPDDRLLDHLYGTAALADPDETNAGRGLDTRVAYAHDVEQMLRHFGRPPQDVEVLDFGSGTGLWLRMAAAFGCRTSGAELTEEGLLRISAAGHMALRPDDQPEGHYDFINTEQVVEHLVDPSGVVRQLVGALRPGGILRISVPNGSDIRERLARGDWNAEKGSPSSLNAVAPLEHLNCFGPGALTRLGTSAGLVPFRYPVRNELHQLGRVRYIAGALRARVRPVRGTLQLFRKP